MSKDRYYYDLRCYWCGRFVSPDADSESPYGRATDIEPPPDRLYCPRCAESKKKDYISGGRIRDDVYRKSRWQTEADEFLGTLEGCLAERMEAGK